MLPISDDAPRRHPALVTWGLVLANVLVFALQVGMPERALQALFQLYGVVPARFAHPDWAERAGFPPGGYWVFLTSQFLHGGWIHLFGNMWTLWIFGDNVEDRMGPLRFLAFYLLCGTISGVAHAWFAPDSVVPAVGASGAIAGVLGAYFLLFPRARILAVVPVLFYPVFLELPAVLYLGFWFVTQVLSGTLALTDPAHGGGVAWWAHVGGFLAGILSFGVFLRPRRRAHGR